MNKLISIALWSCVFAVNLNTAAADENDSTTPSAEATTSTADNGLHANQTERIVSLDELLNPSVEVFSHFSAKKREQAVRDAWKRKPSYSQALRGKFESYLVDRGTAPTEARQIADRTVKAFLDCAVDVVAKNRTFDQLREDDLVELALPCLYDVLQRGGLTGSISSRK